MSAFSRRYLKKDYYNYAQPRHADPNKPLRRSLRRPGWICLPGQLGSTTPHYAAQDLPPAYPFGPFQGPA